MKIPLIVLDKDTQQPLQGAIVDVHETGAKAVTGMNGQVVIDAPVGMFTVTVKYGDRYSTVAMKTRSVTPILV